MYGTIARLKVQPDRVEALQRLTASYDDLGVPGFVGTHVYRMDADDTEYYLVVLFRGSGYLSKKRRRPGARSALSGDARNSSPRTRSGTMVRSSGAPRDKCGWAGSARASGTVGEVSALG